MKRYVFLQKLVSRTVSFTVGLALMSLLTSCHLITMTPLGKAADAGDRETLLALLDSGANIDQKGQYYRYTPLQWAAWSGHTDIVQLLIEKGADVNAESGYVFGHTPLHAAAYRGHVEIVEILLENGADPTIDDAWGLTAAKLAKNEGQTKIARILEKAEKQTSLRLQADNRPKVSTQPVGVAPVMQISGVAQRWAVVVGVSDYQDSRIPSLRYAAADAKSFYNWLISPEGGSQPPARVKLLINEKATGRNVKEALFVWLKQAIEEDMVVIFFAGHGSPESPDFPENLFLLPYDAQYDSVATTGFPMWDIETALKRFIKAKKVVVIADACHAGGVGEAFQIARRANRAIELNPISSGLQNLSQVGDGVAVITASDDKQLSQESKDWGGGHGVFTYFLLKGLEGEADYNRDKTVTLGELIPYLSEQVRRATRNSQCPTVAGKFDPALSISR